MDNKSDDQLLIREDNIESNSQYYDKKIDMLTEDLSPMIVECTPSNGGYLLLDGTIVVGSVGFGEFFWVGEDLKVLIWSVINVIDDASIALKYSLKFTIFSS